MHATRTLLLGAATLAALGAARPASAAFTPVAALNGATLDGATLGPGVIDTVTFNDADGTTYAAGAGAAYAAGGATSRPGDTVTFTGLGNPLERDSSDTLLDSNFAAGVQGIAQCGYAGLLSCGAAGSTRIAFALPVNGFSLSADDFDTTQAYTFTVTAYGGSTALGSVTASSLADNGASPAILAATSTTPITSLLVSDVPSAGGTGDGDFFLAQVQAVPVPEPGSIGLVAAALAALGVARRARRRG